MPSQTRVLGQGASLGEVGAGRDKAEPRAHRNPQRGRNGGEQPRPPGPASPPNPSGDTSGPMGWRSHLPSHCHAEGMGTLMSPGASTASSTHRHPPSLPVRSPDQPSPRTASRRPGSSPPAAPPALCSSAAAEEGGGDGQAVQRPPASPSAAGPTHLVLELVELLLQRRLLALEQRCLLGLVEGEDVLLAKLANQRVLQPGQRCQRAPLAPRPASPPPRPLTLTSYILSRRLSVEFSLSSPVSRFLMSS